MKIETLDDIAAAIQADHNYRQSKEHRLSLLRRQVTRLEDKLRDPGLSGWQIYATDKALREVRGKLEAMEKEE